MEGLELKLIFKNGQVFLTEETAINIETIGLNKHVRDFSLEAYWIIKVKKVIQEESSLYCEIISYNNGKSEFENSQKMIAEKLSHFQNVSFDKVDTNGLIKTLFKKKKRPKSKPVFKKENILLEKNIIKKPEKFHINRSFYFPIKNINFRNGYVIFKQDFYEYSTSIDIIIRNEEIVEEYDAVKDYFEKALNTKNVKVEVKIDIEDNKVVSLFANSPEIESIDKGIIEEVKLSFLESIIKNKSNLEEENNLLTPEEYFNNYSNDDIELKVFYNHDSELLEDLFKITNTKHYKHLRYLSGLHSYNLMKLRILHKPISFIFLVEGENYFHFIWETLNTKEATYVWRTKKEIDTLKKYLTKINEIIKTIRIKGKLEYITSTEDEFNRVFHDYNKSNISFLKWKTDLEKILL